MVGLLSSLRVLTLTMQALAHLCEFIEDCEFTKLAVRILHLLGVEGPKTPHPTKYIRYIYNRVVLENALVRAAAVTAWPSLALDRRILKSKEALPCFSPGVLTIQMMKSEIVPLSI